MYETASEIPRFCPNCGGAVVEDSRFCRHCGCDLAAPDISLATNTPQQEANQNTQMPTIEHPVNKSRSVRLLLGGGLLVIFVLGAVAIVGSILYLRHRNQSAQIIATSSSATVPTMGQKALQIEAILRGEVLTDADLTGLSLYELRVLRNVHFARYGRKFDRPGLGDYFATCSWYKPTDNYNDNMLTATDKANVKLIVEMEKQNPQSSIAANSTPTSDPSSDIQTTVSSAPPISVNVDDSPGKLTDAKAQRAVQRWMSGGTVSVQGIQEVPQENSAVARLNFTNLSYKLHDPILGGNNNKIYSGAGMASSLITTTGDGCSSRSLLAKGSIPFGGTM